ncbi:hypothetical protein KKE45_00440, partial [Patescibacteria group bacterium]|nr:hypothetical protein [Patescibacteria group bacterium]
SSSFIFRGAGNGYQEAIYAIFKWQDRIILTVLDPSDGAPITAFARRTGKTVSYIRSLSRRETLEVLSPNDSRLAKIADAWRGRPNIWRFFVWFAKGKVMTLRIGVMLLVETAVAFTNPANEIFFIFGFIPEMEWIEEGGC